MTQSRGEVIFCAIEKRITVWYSLFLRYGC